MAKKQLICEMHKGPFNLTRYRDSLGLYQPVYKVTGQLFIGYIWGRYNDSEELELVYNYGPNPKNGPRLYYSDTGWMKALDTVETDDLQLVQEECIRFQRQYTRRYKFLLWCPRVIR